MEPESELSFCCPNFISEHDPRASSNSPSKVNVHFNYRKINSVERNNQARQQSLNLKRYKPNKIVAEPKVPPMNSITFDKLRL